MKLSNLSPTLGLEGPLTGVRMLDLTSVIMGPYATQMLADLGADVIKVEPPAGDVMRHAGPMRNPGMGPLYLNLNRNKRSVVLDLKRSAAREALLKLIGSADVLIHNVRPQAMTRLGLDYETVKASNPGIIYVAAVGFGTNGRYAGKPAYDDLIQGAVGLADTIGTASGTEPRYAPVTIADRVVGLYVANAVSAALFRRERTGVGQSVEMPMFEAFAQFILGDHLAGLTFDPPLGGPLYARLVTPHRRPYATSDGFLCVLIYNDKHWSSFFQAIGQEERFREDPRFSSQSGRAAHINEVYAFVAEIMKTRTSAEWQALLETNDIPFGPVNDIEALLADPHLRDVNFFEIKDHPSEGRLRVVGIPGSWSGSKPSVRRLAPQLGEHTREILREAGLSDEDIAAATRFED